MACNPFFLKLLYRELATGNFSCILCYKNNPYKQYVFPSACIFLNWSLLSKCPVIIPTKLSSFIIYFTSLYLSKHTIPLLLLPYWRYLPLHSIPLSEDKHKFWVYPSLNILRFPIFIYALPFFFFRVCLVLLFLKNLFPTTILISYHTHIKSNT